MNRGACESAAVLPGRGGRPRPITDLPLLPLVMPLAMLLAACSITALNEAPIVDRSTRSAGAAAAVQPVPAAAPAGAERAATREAREGVYVVRKGDTLYSIALEFGQDWRDIARWNGVDRSALIRVDQELRVAPPPESSVASAVPVGVAPTVEVRPLDGAVPGGGAERAAAAGPGGAGSAAAAVGPARPPGGPVPAGEGGRAGAAADPGGAWVWPAPGRVVDGFEPPRNKGLDIAGHEGDPVVAAHDGEVVYSGNGLRDYGNLVILKHSDDTISAYAHNRSIVVAQGKTVKRGQRIAEMGRHRNGEARLHFEIRRQGKPVDPTRYLPSR